MWNCFVVIIEGDNNTVHEWLQFHSTVWYVLWYGYFMLLSSKFWRLIINLNIISIKHFNDIFYNVDLFIINLNFITWFMHQNVLQVKIKISEKVGMMGIWFTGSLVRCHCDRWFDFSVIFLIWYLRLPIPLSWKTIKFLMKINHCCLLQWKNNPCIYLGLLKCYNAYNA